MSDQVQELLQRVYEEGVAKAKDEAHKIIESAKTESGKLLSDSQIKADQIIAEAQKKADELTKNTQSDLKIAAQQTISVIKQKLADMILIEAFDKKTAPAFSDGEFVKKLIMEALTAWKDSMVGGTILLSEKLKNAIDEHFQSSLKQIFEGNLTIDFSPIMKEGFSLAPADGTYKLNFTDTDFANLFKSYLRPRTNQILFKD